MEQKQHYVPEVYLKRFSYTSNGDFYSYKIKSAFKNQKIKHTNKSKECYQINRFKFNDLKNPFFSLMENIGENYIEDNSFKYENAELENIFRDIDFQNNLFVSRATKLIEIIFSIKRRNPSFDKAFNAESAKKIHKRLLANDLSFLSEYVKAGLISKDKLHNIYMEFDRELDKKEFMEDLYRKLLLDIEEGNNKIETQRVKEFLNYRFFVLLTDFNNPFITSDNPGFTKNSKGEIFNLELSYTNQLFFPISPRSLFLIDSRVKDFPNSLIKEVVYKKIEPKDVIYFNICTAMNANAKIFSNSKDSLNYVKAYLENGA